MDVENPGPRNRLRVMLAVVAAFFLPGPLLVLIALTFQPQFWNAGALPTTLVDWIGGMIQLSWLGAIFGSPIVVVSLLVWRLLRWVGLVRYWTFALTGLLAGSFLGLLFAWGNWVGNWPIVLIFSATGVLTGLAVWAIGYTGRSAAGARGKSLPNS